VSQHSCTYFSRSVLAKLAIHKKDCNEEDQTGLHLEDSAARKAKIENRSAFSSHGSPRDRQYSPPTYL